MIMPLKWRRYKEKDRENEEDWHEATVQAVMRAGGSDAGENTYWEYACGLRAGGPRALGHLIWFPDSRNPDSDKKTFTLTMNSGGGAGGVGLRVGDGAAISLGDAGYASIEKIGIRVAAATGLRGGIELQINKLECFLNRNSGMEEGEADCVYSTGEIAPKEFWPKPSTFACTNWKPRVLELPEGTTKIVVTGSVHLVAETMPRLDELTATICIWC